MQQGLIHAYVSSKTFFPSFPHTFCTVYQNELHMSTYLCCILYFPCSPCHMDMKIFKGYQWYYLLFYNAVQNSVYLFIAEFDTHWKDINHLPISDKRTCHTDSVLGNRKCPLWYLIISWLMCVSGHCNPIRKVVSLSDIFSFCFFSCSLRIMICLHSKLLVEMACLQHFMVSTHAWLKKFHKTSCSDVLYVETNTHKRVASLP